MLGLWMLVNRRSTEPTSGGLALRRSSLDPFHEVAAVVLAHKTGVFDVVPRSGADGYTCISRL
jgi:hypothetical protein